MQGVIHTKLYKCWTVSPHRIECTEISFSSVQRLVSIGKAFNSLRDGHFLWGFSWLTENKPRPTFCCNETSIPSNVLNEYQLSKLNFWNRENMERICPQCIETIENAPAPHKFHHIIVNSKMYCASNPLCSSIYACSNLWYNGLQYGSAISVTAFVWW